MTYPNTLWCRNESYFTPGSYKHHKVPATYVKPRYSFDNDWSVYVTIHSKGIFMTGGNSAEVQNLSEKFLYKYEGHYNEHKALDSLYSNSKDTTYFALYSFDD